LIRPGVVVVLGLLSAAVCSAGVIQIGGASGLTSNYITQGVGAVCAAGAGNCIAGSATNFLERNYDTRLFSGATESGTPPAAFTGYVQGSPGTPSGSTLGQFSMISDGLTGVNSNNYWDAASSSATITVPIGIADVTNVWTMLNNIEGAAGGADTSLTFNFGTTSNASSFNDVVVVDLTNSGTSGSSPSGQIGSSFLCATASICTFDNGAVASSSTATATLNSNPTSGVGVTTGVLYTTVYNTAAGIYAGSSGNVVLNDQDFNLAALVAPSSGEYLVSIVVNEAAGSAGQTSLSAITVDTAAPEPSTVFLFLTGLGALGLARLRRK
jgi:hypothetical protein